MVFGGPCSVGLGGVENIVDEIRIALSLVVDIWVVFFSFPPILLLLPTHHLIPNSPDSQDLNSSQSRSMKEWCMKKMGSLGDTLTVKQR